jgi:hypothetical protein
VQFNDTPWVEVSADGVAADNTAIIRCTGTDLGLTHRTYAGEHVAFYLPSVIEGVDLGRITSDFQVVRALDLAYRAEQILVGTTPFRGGVQWMVVDVTDDPVTVPCGISGNPLRLGWEVGKPIHNSCYILSLPGSRVPHWGVMFHEMGHNFSAMSFFSFFQFFSVPSHFSGTCVEAFATLTGFWAWHSLSESASTLGPLPRESIDAAYAELERTYRGALANYQRAGATHAGRRSGLTFSARSCPRMSRSRARSTPRPSRRHGSSRR